MNFSSRRILSQFMKKPLNLRLAKQFSSSSESKSLSFWQKYTAERKVAEKWSTQWWLDQTVVMTVFAITGSSTAFFVRPLLSKYLGIQGNWIDGPWSYRATSLVVMMPIYSCILVTVGTIFGRHHYFKKFTIKMWTRMNPKTIASRFQRKK